MASRGGLSVPEWEKKYGKKWEDDDDEKDSEKKAEKETKRYYKEETEAAEKEAEVSTERLYEDLDSIMEEAGIQKDRAVENYLTNLENLQTDKKTGLDDLDHYVSTASERTEEDLDTALAQETRRFGIEQDKINRELAGAGLTFSDRKPEQVAEETSRLQKEALRKEAKRSFDDIKRYEYEKSRDIEEQYERDSKAAKRDRNRRIEDINLGIKDAHTSAKRTKDDIATSLTDTKRQLERGEKVDIGQIGLQYDQWETAKSTGDEEREYLGA